MSQFLKSLVENCEFAVQRNEKGWQVHAKGLVALVMPIAVGVGAIVLLFMR